LSALGWTFTQRNGPGGPDRLRPAHLVLDCGSIQGVRFLGGQPHSHHLHRFGATAGASATPTLHFVDVVACFGLVGPLPDLLVTHHTRME
jgi:hypothetical protein